VSGWLLLPLLDSKETDSEEGRWCRGGGGVALEAWLDLSSF